MSTIPSVMAFTLMCLAAAHALGDDGTAIQHFQVAFPSMNEAVAALALAGQSDEKAVAWLKLIRDPELQSLCDEAMEELSAVPAGLELWKE